jgi:predicted nucleic acid-binding protein
MKYLIDTSALVRILRPQVDAVWYGHVARGLVAICEPVITETLTIARATEYERVLADLLSTYLWVPVPAGAWDTVRLVGTRLAQRSCHQGLSVVDHLVVATAMHHRLTILHEDADFGTVAQVMPELQEHRISAPID